MTRYYQEMLAGKVVSVVAQDETGVYILVNGQIVQLEGVRSLWVHFPEWDKPRRVLTTSKEYLEHKRVRERNSYTETQPTDIFEVLGTVQEVIRKVRETM